jgi:hypothetical protein
LKFNASFNKAFGQMEEKLCKQDRGALILTELEDVRQELLDFKDCYVRTLPTELMEKMVTKK